MTLAVEYVHVYLQCTCTCKLQGKHSRKTAILISKKTALYIYCGRNV